MPLEDGLARHCVVLPVLDHVGLGVGPFGIPDLLKGGAGHLGIDAVGRIAGQKGRALHVLDLADGSPRGQAGGDLPGGPLPHAVGQQVRPAVQQNAPADLVLPVVVVSETAQGRLQPADDDGDIPKGPSRQVGVDDHRPVGPQTDPFAGRIGVLAPPPLGHGVVGHHRVDIPPRQHHPQPGPAKGQQVVGGVPPGLGAHRHPVALSLQHPSDDGGAEGGVVYIGVPHHDEKVIALPPSGRHILLGNGQKTLILQFQCLSPTGPGGRGFPPPPQSW